MKEMGWTFNFIGANIDVDMMSNRLHIDNKMAFSSDEEGTGKMFGDLGCCMMAYESERMSQEANMSQDERLAFRKKRSKGFFRR